MINIADEKRKILDGTYPSRIIEGRQNKHIEGTREFEQKREQMQKLSPGSAPAILYADAQNLVGKYKGTGTIDCIKGSAYPRETVKAVIVLSGKHGLNHCKNMLRHLWLKYHILKQVFILYLLMRKERHKI